MAEIKDANYSGLGKINHIGIKISRYTTITSIAHISIKKYYFLLSLRPHGGGEKKT
jgi:hypothetical protein